jgi:hypothetical protein
MAVAAASSSLLASVLCSGNSAGVCQKKFLADVEETKLIVIVFF